MSLGLKIAVAVGLVLCVLAAVKQIRFVRRGYRIVRKNRDQFAYEERTRTGLRRVVFDGEMLVGGKNVVYIPDEEAWVAVVPHWARGRREEIINRLRSELGEEKYSYEI